MPGQIILDFNNKKTVFIVMLVEILFLFIFGNGARNGFNKYAAGHYIGDRNGAILLIIIFVLPLLVALFFTVRKLITLQTLKTCGVAFSSNQIRSGDSVDFVVGLTVFRTIKIQEIIFTVTNSNRREFSDGFGGNAFKSFIVYSKSYSLVKNVVVDKDKAHTFPGNIIIPPDAKPSGLTEKEKLIEYEKWSEINTIKRYTRPGVPVSVNIDDKTKVPVYKNEPSGKLISELFEWKFQVAVKIANCPDYSFEEEFRVLPAENETNKAITPDAGSNEQSQDALNGKPVPKKEELPPDLQ